MIFVIEDEFHCEWCGRFTTFDEALSELEARSRQSWDVEPNKAPCVGWQGCGREYSIIQFDDSSEHWKEIDRKRILDVSSEGSVWLVSRKEDEGRLHQIIRRAGEP